MPNIESAKKALRQSIRRQARNAKRKITMKDAVKEVRSLIAEHKFKEAEKLLPTAYQAIDKATKRKIIEKNAANRKKSRLTLLLNKTRA
ncbi:MAG: 30S ribosomal protein S20 [Patescibacteria group bacterium]|mgnify:CR=1 FL=1